MGTNNKEWIKARYEDAKKALAAFLIVYPFGIEDLEDEIWKDIEGYDGDYQESNYGRTKSFKNGKIKILRPSVNVHGYLTVRLNSKTKPVHILVAKTFIPNPDNLSTINHIDGIKFNCHVSNFEWLSVADNNRHARRMGLVKTGTESSRAKLTAEQVKEIRNSFILGDKEYGIRPLAKKYGVNRLTIKKIVKGETYKNVE